MEGRTASVPVTRRFLTTRPVRTAAVAAVASDPASGLVAPGPSPLAVPPGQPMRSQVLDTNPIQVAERVGQQPVDRRGSVTGVPPPTQS
jgi:hypothetical protein